MYSNYTLLLAINTSWNLSPIDVVLKSNPIPEPKPNQTFSVNRRQIREKWKHVLNIEMLKIRDYRCKQ